MATRKEYRDFVLEQLNLLENITCRPMMGEYLLYLDGLLFGGIYDSRLLVKIVETNKKFAMSEEIPYEGAKPMFKIEDIEDKKLLKEIVLATCAGLGGKNERKI